MSPIERVLRALGESPEKGSNGDCLTRCPAHDDRSPSLSIKEMPDGRVLLHCFGGCAFEAILGAIGLTKRDLYPSGSGTPSSTARRGSPPPREPPAPENETGETPEPPQPDPAVVRKAIDWISEQLKLELCKNEGVLAWAQENYGFPPELVSERRDLGFWPEELTLESLLERAQANASADSADGAMEFDAAALLATGLFEFREVNSATPIMVNRLTFAYIEDGQRIYLAGRQLPDRPAWNNGAKYLKTMRRSEHRPYISAAVTGVLWGADILSTSLEELFVAEGLPDAVALSMEGLPVISAGTTRFSKDISETLLPQLQSLANRQRECGRDFRLVFIPDREFNSAGRRAVEVTAKQYSEAGINCQIIELPYGAAELTAIEELEIQFPDVEFAWESPEEFENPAALKKKTDPTISLHGRENKRISDPIIAGIKMDAAAYLHREGTIQDLLSLPRRTVRGPRELVEILESIGSEGRVTPELAQELGERLCKTKGAEHQLAQEQARAVLADVGIKAPKRLLDSCIQTARDADSSNALLLHPTNVADAIMKRVKFARDGVGELYHFNDGRFDPCGENRLRKLVKLHVINEEAERDWSTRLAQETIGWISADAPELWERPPLGFVNVSNGILDIDAFRHTGNPKNILLKRHSPEHLSPVQLPVEFDPTATCPAWDEFIWQTFPADARGLAYEIVAWFMVPHMSIQQAVLLLGSGGNGKSTFLAGLRAFLGSRNVSAVSLHDLEDNRFATYQLIGKLANVSPDLPNVSLKTTSRFKTLTGGDPLYVEKKFKDGRTMDHFCRLIFSANEPPRSSDHSEGFFDRWIVIPFTNSFRGSQKELSRSDLDSRLASPTELSGLLNRALEVLPRVLREGLSSSPSLEGARAEFQFKTDPAGEWIATHVERRADCSVPKQDVYGSYRRDLRAEGGSPISSRAFNQSIERIFRGVKSRQIRTGEGRPRSWIGLTLKSQGDSGLYN